MRTVTALLTNKAYGYPTRGARRRRKPTILACLHQTANAKATAMQERNYANRAGSWGPSATAYIDRDGTIVRAIDPAKYAAWSQGDVAHPNTKIPTIAAAVASGVNMNEWVHESIECSGAGTEPFTDAQFESVAQLVAAASQGAGHPDQPQHRGRPRRHQQREPAQRPLAAGHPRGPGQARDRPGERDPAAADRDGHREGGRHASARSPRRTG